MTAKRVAYLTMYDMGDYVTDFHLSFDAMSALGRGCQDGGLATRVTLGAL